MKKNTGLVPLRNFAQISKNLFRSAQPEYSYEYAWLKKVAMIVVMRLDTESKLKIIRLKIIAYLH
jgi:hypothetical protein